MSDLLNAYKNTMASWATGVAIVTANGDEYPLGMTINSLTSICLEPATVLISIHKKAGVDAAISKSGAFAVSILAEIQQELGMRFADPRIDMQSRFENLATQGSPHFQIPFIKGSIAFLECTVSRVFPMGDHNLYFGEVKYCQVTQREKALLYFQRAFRAFAGEL